MKYYGALISHLIVIFCAWISPFVVDWKFVGIGVAFYIVFSSIFKYCPLTKLQFGHVRYGFYEYYLRRLGVKLNRQAVTMLVRYLIPGLILLVAIVWQKLLGHLALFP